MKVMFLAGFLSGRGGMEKMIEDVLGEMLEHGVKVHLTMFTTPSDAEWFDALHFSKSVMERETYKQDRFIKLHHCYRLLFLIEQIKKIKPDVIVAMSNSLLVYTRIALVLTGKNNRQLYSWLHFSLSLSNKFIAPVALNMASKHFCISEGIAKQIKQISMCDSSKLVVVYNGTKQREVCRVEPAQVATFVYLGRLMKGSQKRTDDFLSALSMLSGEWRAEVYGDGTDSLWLKNYAVELGIANRVAWHGWVEKPWDEIRAANSLVLTSSTEGFGLVLIEAMARGVPCISSKCETGPSEIVKHGQNGWLYEVGQVEKLASYMQAMVDDPFCFDQNIVRKSVEKYDIRKVVLSMLIAFGNDVR